MYVRKTALEALELWSDSGELRQLSDDCTVDWRWFSSGECRDEQPPFATEDLPID